MSENNNKQQMTQQDKRKAEKTAADEAAAQARQNVEQALAVALDSQNMSVAIQNHINGLTSEFRSAIQHLYSWATDPNAKPMTDEDVANALVTLDNQYSELKTLAEQGHAIIGGMGEAMKELTKQRDTVLRAYGRAFEHGILHAYECDACMEDAAVENMANNMLEYGVEAVMESEQERLMERASAAEDLYAEWAGEDEQDAAAIRAENAERADVLNLVANTVGITTDNDGDYSHDGLAENDVVHAMRRAEVQPQEDLQDSLEDAILEGADLEDDDFGDLEDEEYEIEDAENEDMDQEAA